MINNKTNNNLNGRYPLAEMQNVYKIYKQGNVDVVALKDISLKIFPGEIVIIMGPSGSGKTSLLNILSGLMMPTSGKVFLKGNYLETLSLEERQDLLLNDVGIVFQFSNLIPILTASENIEFPLMLANKSSKERNQRVTNLLQQVNLNDRGKHFPHMLSGGESQRIAIAQAFSNKPSLILADEPTGNVDITSKEKIVHLFKQFIQDDPSKALLIVTHDPYFKRIADRILVLQGGQIVSEVKIDKSEEFLKKNQLLNYQTENIAPDIKCCSACKSSFIRKYLDLDSTRYWFENKLKYTRMVIYCTSCGHVDFKSYNLPQ